MDTTFQCSFCSIRKPTHNKLLKHLQLFHEHLEAFTVTCGLDGCPRTFSRVKSLQNHIRKKHVNCQEYLEPTETPTSGGIEKTSEVSVLDLLNKLTETLKRRLAIFALYLQEKHVVQKCVQTDVIYGVETLLTFFQSSFTEIFEKWLEENGINVNTLPLSMFSEDYLFDQCFRAVNTPYKLEKYCIEHLNLIESVECTLRVEENGKKHTYQYVPLLNTLKLILQDQSTLEHIISRNAADSGSLEDFCDGTIFKGSHWGSEEFFLRLHLYNDEFEIVNPLGSRKSLHKISAFYFTLGNIHPKYRSNLKHIHLSILVYNRLFKQYGADRILAPLISDIQKLQTDGIEVLYEGRHLCFKGTIVTVSADNLSAHSLAGFRGSFSSGRVCRYCLCHYKDLSEKTNEDECVLRTPDIHSYHLQCVAEDPSTSSLYGVTGPCAFSEIPSFSVTKAFPPDVMHDFLEGVVPHVIKLLVRSLHREKIVGVQNVCVALAGFTFGHNDSSSKPAPISERLVLDAKLAGKAVEKWTLFRTLPFIIGHKIPENNKTWQLFLCLREIGEIILAPTIGASWISYLDCLISSFLTDFRRLFPNNVTPKVHFLLHYPRLIQEFGPPRAHWCMRYEAKHLYFKKVADINCNFKNICASLATRNQFRQCWDWQSGSKFEREKTLAVSPLKYQELDIAVQEKLRLAHLSEEETFWTCTEVVINTVNYSVGDCFILDLYQDEIPLFVKVTQIVNARANWFIVAEFLKTLAFETHLHAYQVSPTANHIVFKPGEELDYHRLDCYELAGRQFITLIHRPYKSIV